jgi:nicotinamide mononucleotide adenylyltransferase
VSSPGVWPEADLNRILGMYGAFIVERNGTDIDDALTSLQPYKDNIYVILRYLCPSSIVFNLTVPAE